MLICLFCLVGAVRAYWFAQPRWVVWVPYKLMHHALYEPLWTKPVDKGTADQYAKVFHGKVYRIR